MNTIKKFIKNDLFQIIWEYIFWIRYALTERYLLRVDMDPTEDPPDPRWKVIDLKRISIKFLDK